MNYTNMYQALRKILDKDEQIDYAMSGETAAHIEMWSALYKDKAPWLDSNTQSAGIAAAVAGEIARLTVLEVKSEVSGSAKASYIDKIYQRVIEVSYHVGARPTHQPWQGKVWTRQELVSVCGLGEVTGLKGANCYHDYKPFPPGSVRTYTDEQLQEILEAENTPKEYNGKQYTTYEALQQQRKMERAISKKGQTDENRRFTGKRIKSGTD